MISIKIMDDGTYYNISVTGHAVNEDGCTGSEVLCGIVSSNCNTLFNIISNFQYQHTVNEIGDGVYHLKISNDHDITPYIDMFTVSMVLAGQCYRDFMQVEQNILEI